jgi:hypothetical protein
LVLFNGTNVFKNFLSPNFSLSFLNNLQVFQNFLLVLCFRFFCKWKAACNSYATFWNLGCPEISSTSLVSPSPLMSASSKSQDMDKM